MYTLLCLWYILYLQNTPYKLYVYDILYIQYSVTVYILFLQYILSLSILYISYTLYTICYIYIRCTLRITYTEISWRPPVYLRGSLLYEVLDMKTKRTGGHLGFAGLPPPRQRIRVRAPSSSSSSSSVGPAGMLLLHITYK